MKHLSIIALLVIITSGKTLSAQNTNPIGLSNFRFQTEYLQKVDNSNGANNEVVCFSIIEKSNSSITIYEVDSAGEFKTIYEFKKVIGGFTKEYPTEFSFICSQLEKDNTTVMITGDVKSRSYSLWFYNSINNKLSIRKYFTKWIGN